jgi:lipopolysaccharide transport system permease protein
MEIEISATDKHFVNLRELWSYRELFVFLTWRDILIRYKQTVIGVAWVIIQPLTMMVIFSVIFGKLAKLPSNGIPYPIITYTALLPWQFFSNSLTQASSSVINSSGMVSKIYFPRLIIPASSVLGSMLDFLISFGILIGMMIWYQVSVTLTVVWLPLFFVMAALLTLGTGMWFSALNVAYRDIKFVVPFLVHIGTYISPVGFLSSIVPEKYQLLYSLNPMVGVIDGFRWCLLGGVITPNWNALWLSALIVMVIFVIGLLYFRKMEQTFADII